MREANCTLSPRLLAVARCLGAGPWRLLADIGTDHGYLPVFAVQNGIAKRAVACDVNPGPLAKARQNIERYGLTGSIETRLGSGLATLRPGEADAIVLAGMGGRLIMDLLAECLPLALDTPCLILQPQLHVPEVRRYIHIIGLEIADECMAWDSGKFYTVLRVQPGVGTTPYDDREYRWGRHNLIKREPDFLAYVRNEKQKNDAILQRLAQSTGMAAAQKQRKLMEQNSMCERILAE